MPGNLIAPGGGVPASLSAGLIPAVGFGGLGGATGFLCCMLTPDAGETGPVPLAEGLRATFVELRAGGAGRSSRPSPPSTGDVLARYKGFFATGGSPAPLPCLVAIAAGGVCCEGRVWGGGDDCRIDDPVRGGGGGGGAVVLVFCIGRGATDAACEMLLGTVACRRGSGGGGVSRCCGDLDNKSSAMAVRPTLAGSEPGSNGGGSLLPPGVPADVESVVEWLMTSYAELAMLDSDCLDDDRGIDTQSGSSDGVNGFPGLFGLSTVASPLPALGGGRSTRADCPLASHHFWRSDVAGGRPGSMAS